MFANWVGRVKRTNGCCLASDSLRAIRRWGDNVLDLRDSIKASLADRRATALPKGGEAGYNDAALLRRKVASKSGAASRRRQNNFENTKKLLILLCDEFSLPLPCPTPTATSTSAIWSSISKRIFGRGFKSWLAIRAFTFVPMTPTERP